MPETHKTIFVASLSTLRTGTMHERLPLHVTIVPPFQTKLESAQKLAGQIGEVVHDKAPFMITGLEEDYYGPERDIRVRKVGGSVLYSIHDQILPIAKRFDRDINQTFTGDNYSPYISYIGPVALEADQRRTIDCLTLAQKQHDKWHVVESYQLNQPNTNWWMKD